MIREPAEGAGGEPPFVHEPAEPAPRVLIPDRGGFVRGVGLLAMAAAAFAGAGFVLQKLGWLAAPLVGVLGASGVLSLWAGVIHVTGGEKFDDHPWV